MRTATMASISIQKTCHCMSTFPAESMLASLTTAAATMQTFKHKKLHNVIFWPRRIRDRRSNHNGISMT